MPDVRSDFQRRIGVGEPQHVYGRHVGRTNTTPVIADDGPRAGRPVGTRTEHWSGRVDAKATSAQISVNPHIVPVERVKS